jgi:hypothetical protein
MEDDPFQAMQLKTVFTHSAWEERTGCLLDVSFFYGIFILSKYKAPP